MRRTYPRERMSRYWKKQKAHTRTFLKNRAKYVRRAKKDGTWARSRTRSYFTERSTHGKRMPALPGCTREQTRWFWRQARFEATLTMKKLIQVGVVNEDEVSANKALHYALTVLKAPVEQKVGLQAANIILTFTKSKPVAKSEVTINKAEEWLAAVTADNEQVPDEDAGDAEASS